MFEMLYSEKLKFNWYKMEVLIKDKDKYERLNLDNLRSLANKSYYEDWEKTIDELAYNYGCSSGYVYLDCPVSIDNCDTDSLFTTKDSRIELNMYIFMGIYYGYMQWKWGDNYSHRLNKITLLRNWFMKGAKEC